MVNELNLKYGISESVVITKGLGDLTKIIMRHSSGNEAEVYLHGAHVTSWRSPHYGEMFFVSERSEFKDGKAIRGGIPISFPQFSTGELPSHGLVRTQAWEIISSKIDESGDVRIVLQLKDTEFSRKLWPFKFKLEFAVILSEKLVTSLKVTNLDNKEMQFQSALHSYFRISKIEAISIFGLSGSTYIDKLRNGILVKETEDNLKFSGPRDIIFQKSPEVVSISDPGLRRSIVIEKEEFNDSVVWNPGKEGSNNMKDMHENGYLEFVCVESANVLPKISLDPGEEHFSTQILSLKEAQDS